MRRRAALLLALLVLAWGYWAFDLGRYLHLEGLKAAQASLSAWQMERPVAFALSYFVGYVLAVAASVPGATVLTLGAGALFGLGWGMLLVSFASTLGATLAFLASRWLLADWVRARFGPRLAAVDAGVAREGAYYLFTLRLVPAVPFFVINLAMGLTRMRVWTFYWVSQLGMLAGTLVYVNAGTQLAAIDSLSGIVSPPLLASLVMLGVFPLLARRALEWLRARRVYAGWSRPGRFDRNLIVIGAGSAGLVTAYIAAALKASVTLVEKHRMGGDCLNTGCVPSKALIRSARLMAEVRKAEALGMRSAQAEVDFGAVMERVQRVVRDIEPHDSVARYSAMGVDVVQGEARLVTPWEVEITAEDGQRRRLSARAIVIAAGAGPYVPPIPGIEQVEVLTSDNVWALRSRPQRLLVLGGGPIGCELAQAFARLGAQVTLLEMAPRLLMREDAEVSDLVAQGLLGDGVTLRLGWQAQRVEVQGEARRMVAARAGQEDAIAFDQLLVAVGRKAHLQGYGLQELGVRCESTVQVNGYLQTNFPNIYAAGDVAGPYQFTHAAAHQAWYAAVNALFAPFKRFKVDLRVMPAATFVDPEVARVGLNEVEAQAQGVAYEVTRFELNDLDRAIADDAAHGVVKLLTEPGRDRILGVTIVGQHAAELLAEYVLAMKHGIGLNKLLGTVHIYPTMAEANKYAAGAWKRAHAPQGLLRWVERFHAWRRG